VRLVREGRVVVIGQIVRLDGRLAKLHNWPVWVFTDQLVPMRRDMS
jgi:hypothetical protein